LIARGGRENTHLLKKKMRSRHVVGEKGRKPVEDLPSKHKRERRSQTSKIDGPLIEITKKNNRGPRGVRFRTMRNPAVGD